jgi:hypothetical protein
LTPFALQERASTAESRLAERDAELSKLRTIAEQLKRVAILRAKEKSEVVIQLGAVSDTAAKFQAELVAEREASAAVRQSEARLSLEMQSLHSKLQGLETRARVRANVVINESSQESSQPSSSYNLRGHASSPPPGKRPVEREPVLDGTVHASGGRESGQRQRARSKGFSLSVGYGRLEASTIQSLDDLSWVDGDEDEVLVSFSYGAGLFGLYPAVLSSTADSMLFCFEDGRKLQSSKVYSPAIFADSFTHLSVCVVHLNGHRSWLHTCFCCLTQASFWTPLMQ